MPTTGAELIQAWEMPQDAWTEVSVKVSRNIKGTERYELIDECAVGEFRMADVAGQFGPGRYKVSAGAGPYSGKETTFTVAPEYATRNGYGAAPATASEMLATRTAIAAQQGPVDPLQLAQMIEVAVEKATRKREPEVVSSGMEGLALIMRGFELAGTMQAKALDTVRMMGGLPPAAAVETKEKTIWDALLDLGPQILQTVQVAMTATPGVQQAARHPAQPAKPPVVISDPQPAPKEVKTMPEITQEEADAIAPIVGMMAPYAGKLVPFIKSGAVPVDTLADQLMSYVGPGLYDSIVALDSVCKQRGAGVLRAIHADLDDPRAVAVVAAMADAIRALPPED